MLPAQWGGGSASLSAPPPSRACVNDLWDKITWSTCNWNPGRRNKLMIPEKSFEEIRPNIFPNLMKNINSQVQEAQQTLIKISTKRPTPGHIQTIV